MQLDWQPAVQQMTFWRHTYASLFAIALTVCLALSSAPGFAATSRLATSGGGGVVINAASMFRDADRQIIELKGDVQVVYDGQHMMADYAIIYLATKEIEARGNLVISSPTAYVEGESARMNYETDTGVIINGFVQSGQVVFEGKVVRKVGPELYEADRAYYTACATCPPSWSFTGTRINARIGGYAHIRNPIFQIAHVPVFWLPYIIVPLKSQRQTGLLVPSYDYSGVGGHAITLPLFWAISRSQDATIAFKHYERRGPKGLLNYRYMLSESSLGELNAGYIADSVFSGEQTLLAHNPQYAGDPNFKRWFTTYRHLYDLPDGYVNRVNLNLVSDLRYPLDFPEEVPGWGDPALTNSVSLTRNTKQTHASIEAAHYTNLLTAARRGAESTIDPLGSNRSAVHRFPEIRFDIVENDLAGSGFLFNLRTNYTNFARSDFAYDDVVGTGGGRTINTDRADADPTVGVFTPDTDVIRSGQRLDMQPQLSYPLQIGPYLDVLPSASFRHTQYSFGVTPDENSTFDIDPYRQYLQTQLSVRTRLSHVYGSSTSERGTLYRHEIQPEIIASSIPWIYQPDHSFFGTSTQLPSFRQNKPITNEDFFGSNGVQFDYFDRITNRNVFTYVVNNKLVRKNWSAGSQPDYSQIVNLRIAQSYDLDEAEKTTDPRFPWSDISALLDVRLGWFETNTILRYFPYHNVTDSSSRVQIKNSRGDYLQVSFIQNFLITENTNQTHNSISENVGLGAGFVSRYFNFSGAVSLLPRDLARWAYQVQTWSANILFTPPGDCWSISLNINQQIEQKPAFKFAFDFSFGGL